MSFSSERSFSLFKRVLLMGFLLSVLFLHMSHIYSKNCPKRLFVGHVNRSFQPNGKLSTDSGIWAIPLDYTGLKPVEGFLAKSQWKNDLHAPLKHDYEMDVYGSYPWFYPLKNMMGIDNTMYLSADPMVLPSDAPRTSLDLIGDKYSEETNRRKMHFVLKGPPIMTLTIDARDTTLTAWSLGNGTDGVPPVVDDSYYLRFASGKPRAEFHFWIETVSPKKIKVAFSGYYMDLITEPLKAFMDVMPDWVDVIPMTSEYKSVVV